MNDERHYKILETAEDVTDDIAAHVRSCVDWFENEATMPTEEFIDQLCKTYGGRGYHEGDFDMERYDNEAAKKIMRIARAERKERQA